MKHKTWFRLVIKAIGILLIGLSLPGIGQALGFIVYLAIGDKPSSLSRDTFWLLQGLYYAGSVVQLALGLYLLLGGKWIVDRCIPSNRQYCPDCGYDLSRSSSDRCAECGTLLPREAPPPAQA
jgi:hypothetical protein